MKKIAIFAIVVLSAMGLQAQPPEGKATPGKVYGDKKTTIDNARDIALIPELLNQNDSFSTKVVAKVLDVCPKKGCWVKLQVDENTEAFVKMKNYGFFVPLDLIGKTIVLDGDVKLMVTSVDELRHYAEDAKKSKEEIESITEPKKEIRFTANGIVVVK